MSSTQTHATGLFKQMIPVEDARFDLLFKRNQYLEKEYAKVMRQLQDEKEKLTAKHKELQQLHELVTRCNSLQVKQVKLTERLNDYHCQMQQAKGETIGLRRKIMGILGHIRTALSHDAIPGSPSREPVNNYQRIYEENKLLKWKLNVVEGYFAGMFAEEGELLNNSR